MELMKADLEVLATNSDYQKKGLGSKLIEWGIEKADAEGLESYLDAAKGAQRIYEKYGYVEQTSAKDPKARSAPMLRPARMRSNKD
jgi:GNAT superfamily N-acetyltransferase